MKSLKKLLFVALVVYVALYGHQLTEQFKLANKAVDLDALLSEAVSDEKPFMIGSFNLKNYGPAKANRTSEYIDPVARILARYDIALLQEVQDVSLKAVPVLVEYLNSLVKEANIVYTFVLSPRMGSSNRKEQYAFVYRVKSYKQEISVLKDFVYEDVKSVYERPPHIAKFRISGAKSSIKEFYMANIHTRPTDVFTEVAQLRDMTDQLIERENLTDSNNYNIAVMGDFNFACSYISAAEREIVRTKILNDYTWHINDANPTTISKSGCAYDRIIVNGNKFNSAIFPYSNRTYRYDYEQGLTSAQVTAISDHYPIEFQLY